MHFQDSLLCKWKQGERNGIVPIMGRVTINGTIAQFSCKQSVTKAI